MNVLILTSKFGYGHISAANSIMEKIKKENPNYNILIIDLIEYLFPNISKLIYKSFNFLVDKCCTLYNFLNRIGSKNSKAPLRNIIIKKIDKLLFENNIDMIISVFPVCSAYISTYKKTKKSNIILKTCITDIEPNKEWVNDETDMYFVASLKTKNKLIDMGVPKKKIIVSGIPVSDNFITTKDGHASRNVLIMGGGLGLIPNIKDFLLELEKQENLKINVIVGNNKKLYSHLSQKYENINIIGFTKEVSKYMKEADLIVTKSGGITMFEAINSETPLLVLKPFLNQEIGNALFIENNKIGEVLVSNDKLIAEEVLKLIDNNQTRLKMIDNMQKIKKSFEQFSFTSLKIDKGGN